MHLPIDTIISALLPQDDHDVKKLKPTDASKSIHPKAAELFNVLIHLDMDDISKDIWKVISDYGVGKIIKCVDCDTSKLIIDQEEEICSDNGVSSKVHKLSKLKGSLLCKECYDKKKKEAINIPRTTYKFSYRYNNDSDEDSDADTYYCNGCGHNLDASEFLK